MTALQLQLPAALQKLIDSAVWPVAANSIVMQELNPLLGVQAARKLSPIDDKIILMPPPFHTIADEVAGGNFFWTDFLTNVGEIDYAKALIIADFGMGTDSPIILYYDTPEPSVMYLHPFKRKSMCSTMLTRCWASVKRTIYRRFVAVR